MVLCIGNKSILTITNDPHIVKRYYFSEQIETIVLKLPPIIYTKTAGDTGEIVDNDGEDSSKSPNQMNQEKRHFVFGQLSQSEKYLAICDNFKNLIVYCTKEWKVLASFVIERKCDHVIFNEKEGKLIVSNRSGWIYGYQLVASELKDDENGETFLLGHNAIILDLKLSLDSRYLASCDRDEKIRISNYPNCYNIESYCLGHTQFVSCLAFINEQLLISGSGDGTLRVWQFTQGKELSAYSFANDISAKDEKVAPLAIHSSSINDQIIVTVTFYNSSIFVTYKFDTKSNCLEKITSTDVKHNILYSYTFNNQLVCFIDDKNNFVSCQEFKIVNEKLEILKIDFKIMETLAMDDQLVETFLNEKRTANKIEWLYKSSHDHHNEYFERKKERQETKMVKKIKSS
ncbi:tRNA (guanine-N(7)-)-methyltransferase non-catalytic subunit wdr4 [Tetranychus urticae]|uniref:tRNA (guanine-N(7)-)-methyltransferase non-catalytic subunit n=1 Tax=Tetranychus urticae TaxID=32264 RepID=T1KZ87_TETUR|nr:tRNA (guanine-N(7)-)-methyltransferase non-catalytic subunit wdr4 [Tetranychus urticae]